MLLLLFCVLNSISFFLGLFFFVIPFPSKVRLNKSGILYDAFFYLVAFFIYLPLKLCPNFNVDALIFKPVPYFPDCREIWYILGKTEKVAERQPVMALKLKLLIRQPIQALQEHGAQYNKLISMRTPSNAVVIIKYASDKRDKWPPINLFLH